MPFIGNSGDFEPVGIMPRQSPTRLGVDNHALRARVKLLRQVLQQLVEAQKAGAVTPELLKEAEMALQATIASDVLDVLGY